MFSEFQKATHEIFCTAQREGRLTRNPGDGQLRQMALQQPEARQTRYGNVAVTTEPQSRCAKRTANNIDTRFGEAEAALLAQARQRLGREELVSVEVLVGDGSEEITARLIVPRRFAHLAYGGRKMFRPTVAEEPTFQVLFFFDEQFEGNRGRTLPEKDLTIRLAHAADGRMVKIVRNSNYLGEWKKGVFAGEDFRTKLTGNAIMLHASCRKDTLETAHGPYKTSYSLFVALSANGKTAASARLLARKGRERSWLIQEDGGALGRDGSFKGYEGGGLYVRTEGLNSGEQVETYYGCLKPETLLENVFVEPDGSLDFFNLELTGNGRAVIERRDFLHAGRLINAEAVDHLFLITRGSIVPAVAKLTHEEAAAYLVLGQAMESSSGDPTQAGHITHQFFYDPFLAGDRAEHANLFYDILKCNSHIQCFLLNMGWIGNGEIRRPITVSDTMGILDSVLRGGLEDWLLSPRSGFVIPRSVRTVDSILMRPEKLFVRDELERLQQAWHRQRAECLDRYPGLNAKIRAVFQK